VGIIEDIAAIFVQYPYIVSVIGTVGSFIAGWLTSERRLQIEASKEHFKELKEHVIKPLIGFLNEVNRIEFPSTDDLSENGLPEYYTKNPQKIDRILFKDFIDNHYPHIREEWTSTYQLTKDSKEKKEQVVKLIEERLIEEAINRKISYIYKSPMLPDNLYITTFADDIFVVISKEMQQNYFIRPEKDGRSVVLRKNIYICKDIPIEEVIEKIKEISENVFSNGFIVSEIKTYNELSLKRDFSLVKLGSDLNITLRKTNLKLLRKSLIFTKCQFIQTG